MDVPLHQLSNSDVGRLRLLGLITDLSGSSENGAVLDVQLADHSDVNYDLATVRDEPRAFGQKDLVMIDARLTGPVYATPKGQGI